MATEGQGVGDLQLSNFCDGHGYRAPFYCVEFPYIVRPQEFNAEVVGKSAGGYIGGNTARRWATRPRTDG